MSSRPESQRDPNAGQDAAQNTNQNDEAVRKFIEDFALLFASFGMPRMPARVFTALLATQQESLTAGELAEALQVSPAAISGAVRYLDRVNMIQRGREPGSRRDHYYIGEDLWYDSFARNDTYYKQLASMLESGLAAAGAGTRAGKRIQETRDFFAFIGEQLPALIEQWRQERADEQDDGT